MPRGKPRPPLWPLPPVRPAPPRVTFTAARLQGPPSGLRGALLAVAADGQARGTAALVGPGLALCARHVFGPDGLANVAVRGAAGDTEFAWKGRQLLEVPDSDLAVLSMSLASALPAGGGVAVANMTTRMLAEGDEVTLLAAAPDAAGAPQSCRGRVAEVFLGGRERVTGPAVAVSCAPFEGISSAVVFDDRGYLVGVVSSTSTAVTYVSHIVPALMIPITPEWPEHERAPSASLLHLGTRHGVHLERPDAFQVGAKAGKVVVRYMPWS